MFIYVPLEARRCCGVAEMQQGNTARIKVWRMLEENLILEWLLSVHAAAAASALHESTVNLQGHERSLSGAQTVTVPRWCFSFFICIIFIWPLTFFLLPLHLCPLWLFLLLSIFILQDKTSQQQTFFLSHFWIFLFLVSQKQFSQLPSPLLLSSADPVHTNLLSEAERLWSRTTASGAPWCGPSGAPLQWGWCLIKPPASTPSMPVLPWPPPSVGAVEVHRTHTLYYKLPVLELPLFFTAVCV